MTKRSVPCVSILMINIILHLEAKALEPDSNSCEVTRSTVQVVNGCPDSKDSWREAAEKKRCDVFAKECAEPKRLVYHCVINPYVNQTIEVCAYAQNIVGGKCTSYSSSENVIQENWEANCSKFIENTCPQFYRSNEAYKYQGCYQLITKSTAGTNNPKSTRYPDNKVVFTTTSANISSNMSTNKHVEMSREEEIMDSNPIVIAIVVTVLFVAIIGLVVSVIRKRNGEKLKRRGSLEIPKAEAHRDEVKESLCYTLGVGGGVGVRTWLKFLLQVLYLSYYLSYLHQTCMDDASGPTYGLERLGC